MIESFNFEYKQTKMFHDIQPAGLSVYGERGVEGKDGLSGSTVYFINYSTISEDLKYALLNRINDSIDLDGHGDTRIYHNNDLIICEISENIHNYIYRIVKTYSESKPYDIEKLGYIKSKTNIVNLFDCIHSLKINRDSYETTECHVPVNRSYEYSTANNLSYINGVGTEDAEGCKSDYSAALRLLFGFYVSPEISLTDRDIINHYDFYLKIHIKNRKSILGRNNLPVMRGYSDTNTSNINEEPFTDKNNINNVLFEKVIEIPVSKLWRNGSIDEPIDEKKPYFISDMACDKIHPSINNYSSAFFDPYRNNGYITNLGVNLYPFHFFMFNYNTDWSGYRCICIGKSNESSDTVDNHILDNIKSASMSYYDKDDPIRKEELLYCAGSTLIQYSKNPNINPLCGYCEVHYRSGESAYFSSMISDNLFPSNCFGSAQTYTKEISSISLSTFDQYVAAQRSLNKNLKSEYGETSDIFCNNRINIVKDYVCEEMNKFIFNENNVFELVCVDARTGRAKSKILPLNQIL